MANSKKSFIGKFWLPVTLVVLLVINWLASEYHTRVDFTAEKRFTLSSATRKLLRGIDTTIQVDVFLKGSYPSGFKKLSAATDDLLREFREVAGKKFQYRFISPDEEIDGTAIKYADTLPAFGLYPINLTSQLKEGQQQQLVYPAALIHYREQTVPVVLHQGKTPMISFQELNSSEAMLEYRIASAIARLTQREKPIVGYATGNGQPQPGEYRLYDLVENVLRPDYNFFTFDLMRQPFVPAEFNSLIIVKPTQAFTDGEKLKLDQYLMNGGNLIFFIDRLNAEMDSLQVKNEVVAYDRELGLNDLFFKYGARLNADLVLDLQCDFLPFDVSGDGQFELLPWNYFPVLEASSSHPLTKNLGFISGQFVNSIDTIEAAGITKRVLLTSSANARKIGTPAIISGKENVNAPQHEKFGMQHIPVAVLLEGRFRSLYANRLTQAMTDSLNASRLGFMPAGVKPGKIIIVGDGDMILNATVQGGQPISMGMNRFTFGTQKEFPFANKEFFKSCLDYMINAADLSEAKGKDYSARLLDSKKVAEQKTMWQTVNIAGPLTLVLLFALLFQWLRRRRYRH